MKKALLILIAVIGFGFSANAQKICRISGATDGSTIQVDYSHYDAATGYIYFSVSNDSQSTTANFNFDFNVTFSNGAKSGTINKRGSGQAKPQYSDTLPVFVSEIKGGEVIEVKVTAVSSTKCN